MTNEELKMNLLLLKENAKSIEDTGIIMKNIKKENFVWIIDEVVKVLEQQQSEIRTNLAQDGISRKAVGDYISREAVIDILIEAEEFDPWDDSSQIDRMDAINKVNMLPSVTPRTNLAETSQDYKAELKSQMLKYGFKASDMTVTEFVEDCLPPVKPQPCEDAMFFKIIQDIEESDEQQVSYNEEFQLSKYAYVINNSETFKEMGYQVINEESVFGFDTVYLKRNKKAQPTEMRDATEEERKSVKNYIESISKPTGVHFYEAQPTDAVSRSEAITELTALIENFKGIQGDMGSAVNSARELIKTLPPATPQRPKGKWIHPYKSDIACECSECHIQIPITSYYHYCPNCGVKMR